MRICVIVPTYNERKNIVPLISTIQKTFKAFNLSHLYILIIDDNSPDGTGKLVEEISKTYGNLLVLHRPRKLGLGSAYKDGFTYAIQQLKSDIIFEMDADLSHDPKYIPHFLRAIHEGYDVVVGSRRIRGGGVVGWGLHRRAVSWIGSKIAQWLCGISVHDATSGYRAFTRQALERIEYSTLRSESYAFQIETLFRCQKQGLRIKEIPIVFTDRKMGKSKLGVKDWLEFITVCLKLFLKRLK